MFNSHLLKVILGFCGVILAGLISLVIIDSFKDKDVVVRAEAPTAGTYQNTKSAPIKLPPIKNIPTKKTNKAIN